MSMADSMLNTLRDADNRHVIRLFLVSLASLIFVAWVFAPKADKFPYINPPKTWDLLAKSKKNFFYSARSLMNRGRARFPGQPYKIMTDEGEVVILPPKFASEIRNQPGLSFGKSVSKRLHANLPGFEPFRAGTSDDQLLQTVARKQLTKQLNKITEPLSEEASHATQLLFGSSTEWKEVALHGRMLDLIARLSSRVFLGTEVCRNDAWLAVTKSYTVHSFKTAIKLRRYPMWLRSLAHWFMPDCKILRAQIAEARTIIKPVLEKRKLARNSAIAEGQSLPPFNDAIDWAEDESRGRPYDAAIFQLALSVAAIHTTTDLLTKTLMRIAENPELADELRQEILNVLTKDGWRKAALLNLKLLDSTFKETMRLEPLIGMATMNRMATQPVALSSGHVLRTGQQAKVDTDSMRDPTIYADPDTFDPHRFLRMRGEPGQENTAHLVSASPTHLGFGYGEHACPGRFFAANEVKIAMVHLLIKYDWQLVTKPVARFTKDAGFGLALDPTAAIMVKRRVAEIDVDAL